MTSSVFCLPAWTNSRPTLAAAILSSLSSSHVLSHSTCFIGTQSHFHGCHVVVLFIFQDCHNQVPQTEYLENQKCIVSQPGSSQSKIKASVCRAMLPLEDTRERPVVGLSPNFWWFLGLRQLNSSSYVAFSRCTCLYSDFPLVVRTLVILEQRPILLQYDCILTHYICKHPISECSHTGRSWGLGLQPMNFRGHNSVHVINVCSVKHLGVGKNWFTVIQVMMITQLY